MSAGVRARSRPRSPARTRLRSSAPSSRQWRGSGSSALSAVASRLYTGASPRRVPMDVRDAIATRYSGRAFLPTPVPIDIVRDILDRAARAPSGGNLQPWLVHALAGEPLEALKAQ